MAGEALEGLTFRGYAAADFESLFRLDELCFVPPFRFSRTTMRACAEAKRARVVIAEAGDGLAGFVIAHVERVSRELVGYVVTIDVAEVWRRRGLATELMRRAEAQMLDAGCVAMFLHVFTGNAAAIRFYEREGYVRANVAEGFYGKGVDAWVYRKEMVGGSA